MIKCLVEDYSKKQVILTELDKEIALLKLQGMNVNIDVLSEEQEKYLNSWDIGT